MDLVCRVILVALVAAICGPVLASSNVPPSEVSEGYVIDSLDKKIEMIKVSCPECALVATDVIELRVHNCQLKNTSSEMLLGTMKNDPMYFFMLEVYTLAGFEKYKYVKGVAESAVDCGNPVNWVHLTWRGLWN
ncbi:hypothetical protein HLX14_004621 [Escherichia coli]|nr:MULTISPECIES: hypothetical protein [Edwardsiella]EFP0184086.1 hypothetical protein [Escherichia coli]EGA8339108.1 hypothetical protein [Salmonella enterica subsp. enterica serovar Saintpaul]EKG9744421.1 hypothetical protein [Salmonella enterica]EKS7763321.1 hypothetical protein [Edwardsiella ictaluri]EKS7789736.1 hypothetical protein [Edwardsiella ictaluri]